MRRLLAIALVALMPAGAQAQDETERDRDFLTGFLEDNLSGAGRAVRIDGFAGALSSRATFDQMTIADGNGVWITIRGGALSWNRRALLSGRIEVNEISAAEVIMPRPPQGGDGNWAEARGFELPELPVSVSLGSIRIDRTLLGADVLGEETEVTLAGSASLAGGEGNASLTLTRIDGKVGEISLTTSYSNATGQATLDLLAREGPGGLAVNALGVPDRPAAELALHGAGAAEDLGLDVVLSTEGVRRLTGNVTVGREIGEGIPEGTRRFRADLEGDFAPLLLPDYREFFGDALTLSADGIREPSGRIDLTAFDLSARAVNVSGTLAVGADGLPERADLSVSLGLDGGADVLLPIPGERTYVTRGDLRVGYAAQASDGWSLDGRLSGFRRAGLSISGLRLDGSGRVGRAGVQGIGRNTLGGALRFAAGGIDLGSPALAEAFGTFLTGRTVFLWQEGQPLRLSRLAATGAGYSLTASGTVGDLASGFLVGGTATASLRDVSRLSTLAGRSLGGAAELALSGSGSPLSGIFDVTGEAIGRNLTADQPELDRLLAGQSRITASVARNETGTELRDLAVISGTLTAKAAGRISTADTNLSAEFALGDLGALRPGARGTVTASAGVNGPADALAFSLAGLGENLAVGIAEVDRMLRGRSELAVRARRTGGRIYLDSFSLSNPQADLRALSPNGDQRLTVSGRLSDMGILAPDFPGPVTAEGELAPEGRGYRVSLTGTGPGDTNARITGTVSPDAVATDLTIEGRTQSAVFNPLLAPRNIDGPIDFDLRLQGRPSLAALTGTVSANGARLSAPTLGVSMENINATATLGGGRAEVVAEGAVRGGGRVRVTGPVALARPNEGNLRIDLEAVRLRDANLYDTQLDGTLTLTGPVVEGGLIQGRVDLDETELRIPSTGFGTNAFTGVIEHRGDRREVRQTRVRAGLDGAGADGTRPRARPVALDVTINAPRRIFVRGRGLDAEMGGSLRLGGTLARTEPIGQFNLIRGRLDLLGKRFVINEGLIRLEGALVPYLRFAASTSGDGVTSTITVEGRATEPTISFSSSPPLPEDEVVARLLFGRDLSSLSVLQAAQLASAVATLSGRGGAGLTERLRTSFGVDDFDISTGDDGNVGVRVGKYLSENIYTDLSVNSEGKSEVRLNLDVSPSVTVRGRVDSDGDTGLGVFFERDY